MATPPYLNREIDAHFSTVKDELAEIKELAQKTLVQATKTNGRVTTIEEWKKNVNTGIKWAAGIAGSLIVYYLTQL